jgi:hypothetical protein
MGRAKGEDVAWHRQQHLEIKRAALAAADLRHHPRMVRFDQAAELARQDMAAGDGEAPPIQWLGGGEVEDIFLETVGIEPPGNNACPAGCLGKLR